MGETRRRWGFQHFVLESVFDSFANFSHQFSTRSSPFFVRNTCKEEESLVEVVQKWTDPVFVCACGIGYELQTAVCQAILEKVFRSLDTTSYSTAGVVNPEGNFLNAL
mmetsp:Transcript_2298/g.5346  ORF Transcript_2298/g.5346 Transcript_2298/m.5346 type:complete len:108 (-) Transcript_2298:477-800(-)